MRRTVIGVSILVILVLGAGLFVWLGQEEDAATEDRPQREPSAELLKQRGPRPSDTRLRDGAKQIEDPAKALEMARESKYPRTATEIVIIRSKSSVQKAEWSVEPMTKK